jgi:pyruvate formate lyase activating enzyme
VNDDDANVSAIGGFVSHHGVRDIDVLPYHRAGLAKYERLNRANPHVGLEPPTDEALGVVRRRLENFGLTVHIGEAL